MGESDDPHVPQSLAERIDHLFRTVRSPTGREYTYAEVEAAIRARGGSTISASYVWSLRRGTKTNPTKQHLEALGAFFKVPVAYFLDDATADRISAELDFVAALRNSNVRRIALRASELSPQMLRQLAQMVDIARRMENLDNGDSQDQEGDPRSDD